MADLPTIPNRLAVTDLSESRVSAAEVASTGLGGIGKAIDTLGQALDEFNVPFAAAEGANHVTLGPDGNPVITTLPMIGSKSAKAWNEAALRSGALLLDNQVKMKLIELRKQHDSRPDEFMNAAKAYGASLRKTLPAPLRAMGDKLVLDQAEGHYRNMSAVEMARNTKRDADAYEAKIEGLQNDLIELAKSNGTETPEFRQRIEDYIALQKSLIADPRFTATKESVELKVKAFEGRLRGYAILGEVERAVEKDGYRRASELVDSIRDPVRVPGLTPEDRDKFFRLAKAHLGGLEQARRAEAGALKTVGGQLARTIEQGHQPDAAVVEDTKRRAIAVGAVDVALDLEAARWRGIALKAIDEAYGTKSDPEWGPRFMMEMDAQEPRLAAARAARDAARDASPGRYDGEEVSGGVRITPQADARARELAAEIETLQNIVRDPSRWKESVFLAKKGDELFKRRTNEDAEYAKKMATEAQSRLKEVEEQLKNHTTAYNRERDARRTARQGQINEVLGAMDDTSKPMPSDAAIRDVEQFALAEGHGDILAKMEVARAKREYMQMLGKDWTPGSRLPEARGGFAALLRGESGGRDDAYNEVSGATGRYQYIRSTWQMLAQSPEGRAAGLQPITRDYDPRKDGNQQEIALRISLKRYGDRLGKAGLPVTDANLGMLHFLGEGGGVAFLQAMNSNPNAPAAPDFGNGAPKTASGSNRAMFYHEDGRPKSYAEVQRSYMAMLARGSGARARGGVASPTDAPDASIAGPVTPGRPSMRGRDLVADAAEDAARRTLGEIQAARGGFTMPQDVAAIVDEARKNSAVKIAEDLKDNIAALNKFQAPDMGSVATLDRMVSAFGTPEQKEQVKEIKIRAGFVNAETGAPSDGYRRALADSAGNGALNLGGEDRSAWARRLVEAHTSRFRDAPYEAATSIGGDALKQSLRMKTTIGLDMIKGNPAQFVEWLAARNTDGDTIAGMRGIAPFSPLAGQEDQFAAMLETPGVEAGPILAALYTLPKEKLALALENKKVSGAIVKLTRSGDVRKMTAGFSFIDRRTMDNQALAAAEFGEKALKSTSVFLNLAAYDTPEEATKRMMRYYDKGEAAAIDAVREAGNKWLNDNRSDIPEAIAKEFWGISSYIVPNIIGRRYQPGAPESVAAGDAAPHVEGIMKSRMENDAKELFNHFVGVGGLGFDTAWKETVKLMKTRWMPSRFAGGNMAFLPPEITYAGKMVGDKLDWMDKLVKDKIVKEMGGDKFFQQNVALGMPGVVGAGLYGATAASSDTLAARELSGNPYLDVKPNVDIKYRLVPDAETQADFASGRPARYNVVVFDPQVSRWRVLAERFSATQDDYLRAVKENERRVLPQDAAPLTLEDRMRDRRLSVRGVVDAMEK